MTACVCGCRNCGNAAVHASLIESGIIGPGDGTFCPACDQLWCRNHLRPVPGNATHTPCCGKDLRIVLRGAW